MSRRLAGTELSFARLGWTLSPMLTWQTPASGGNRALPHWRKTQMTLWRRHQPESYPRLASRSCARRVGRQSKAHRNASTRPEPHPSSPSLTKPLLRCQMGAALTLGHRSYLLPMPEAYQLVHGQARLWTWMVCGVTEWRKCNRLDVIGQPQHLARGIGVECGHPTRTESLFCGRQN